MQQFLKDLFEEIEGADIGPEAEGPRPEVREREVVVGVMPDNLKRIYVVFHQSCESSNAFIQEHQARLERAFNTPRFLVTSDDWKLMQEYVVQKNRHEILEKILWTAVKEAFPNDLLLVSNDTIAIRRDWKVVLSPMSDLALPSLSEIMSMVRGS